MSKKSRDEVSTPILSQIMGVSSSYMSRALRHLDVVMEGGEKKKSWSLEDTHQLLANSGRLPADTCGKPYSMLFVNNYPNTWKTTLTINFAHYLRLKGYRVLVIDLDSKASTTNFFLGKQNARSLEPDETISAVLESGKPLTELVLHTDRHGIDLVPSSPSLFSAELDFARSYIKDDKKEFWNILKGGLLKLTDYHVVLIDLPSVFNYVAISAAFEANNIVLTSGTDRRSIEESETQKELLEKTFATIESKTEQKRALTDFNILLSTEEPETLAEKSKLNDFTKANHRFVLKNRYPISPVLREAEFSRETLVEYEMAEASHESKRVREAMFNLFGELAKQVSDYQKRNCCQNSDHPETHKKTG